MRFGLDHRQALAAVHRSSGATWPEVAAAVGVSERTVRRWSVLPAFDQALAALVSERTDRLRMRAAALDDAAVAAVADAVAGGDVNAALSWLRLSRPTPEPSASADWAGGPVSVEVVAGLLERALADDDPGQ